MYFIKDALSGVLRNKKRYGLIALATAVVVAGISIASMVWFTAVGVIADYSDRFGASVYFTPDLKKAFAQGVDENGYLQIPDITAQQLRAFAESKYLKETLYRASIQTYGEDITGIDEEYQKENPYAGSFAPSGNDDSGSDRTTPNCVVIGYSDYSLMQEFATGLRQILQGNYFNEKNTCMVSEEFAKKNGLEIGDVFDLFNVDNEEQGLSLTVVGIYLDGTTARQSGYISALNNRRNEILVSYATLEEQGFDDINLKAVYYLENPEYAQQFEDEIRQKGLPEVYNVNTDADTYYKIVEPIKGLKKIVEIMFILVMVVGALVLALFATLLVYDRKYEIGILRAVGMKKRVIIGRMMLEYAIVSVLGMAVGIGLGGIFAPGVSDMIIKQQVNVAQKQYNSEHFNYGEGVIKMDGDIEEDIPDAVYELSVDISGGALAVIILSTLVLSMAANAGGVIFCIRKEPMKLLVEKG